MVRKKARANRGYPQLQNDAQVRFQQKGRMIPDTITRDQSAASTEGKEVLIGETVDEKKDITFGIVGQVL